MKTRATLTIDPSLHARAKRLAKQRRTSVSGLFEAFIKEQAEAADTSVVEKMRGSATLKPAKANDPRRAALESKYLKK
jgi:hypothetical protein